MAFHVAVKTATMVRILAPPGGTPEHRARKNPDPCPQCFSEEGKEKEGNRKGRGGKKRGER